MLIIYNHLRKDSFFFNAKMHGAKVHRAKIHCAKIHCAKVHCAKVHRAKLQRDKNENAEVKGSKVQKYKLLQQGTMFIWPEMNNILDFGTLHFGIIKSSDDEVLIRIYLLASRNLHLSVY
jgi:hypothetical protein